jgi:hypothetical protein
MTERTNGEAADRLFAAWERWDLETVEALLAENAIDTRPQSGERFIGRANIIGMYREVPGPPRISWASTRGGPHVWVAEGTVEYGEGPVQLIGIVELANGQVVRADYYFADRFDPPESRARWTGQPLTDR